MTLTGFGPLTTDRLLIRPVRRDDRDALIARRNEPEPAHLQSWTIPWPAERADSLIADVTRHDGPGDDRWWMLTISDRHDRDVIGDVTLRSSWNGRTVEVGYTLAGDRQGRGYAAEAVDTVIGALFDRGVHRVAATMHPDNRASAQVVERCGLLCEGRTTGSFWVGDDSSDDVHYGVVRSDWEAWRSRPRTPPAGVTLVEITPENDRAVRALRTHESQLDFVAPVVDSLADALVPEVIDGAPVVPWMRGVEADGELVGFVMIALRTDAHPEPYLWRLLVDRMHQRRGVGTKVLDLLVEQCRAWDDPSLLVSWQPGRGSPEPLYLGYGFEPTGRIVEGEIEARLPLRA